MKILIYNSGGGLGDSIQLFDLITSLKEKYGEEQLYYLSAHNNHFNNSLRKYNNQLKELKTDIIYFGFRLWHLFCSKKKILKDNLIDKFDLIIEETTLSGPPLVSALSTRLEKAISIDNGIMHMIGLANIPMIVLFGPTNSKKFAPKINKIDILDSNLIYNSSDISKISENDVLNLIK